MANIKEQIRSKTIGAKANFRKEIVEVNDIKVEVRQPSVSERGKIMKRSRDSEKVETAAKGKKAKDVGAEDVLSSLDYGKMQAWATIYCSYVPETDEKVYEEQDFEALLNRPAGGFVDKLSTAAMNLMNVQAEEDAKN